MLSATTILVATGLTAALFAIVGLSLVGTRGVTLAEFLTARRSMSSWAMPATVSASFFGIWILFTPAEAGVLGGPAALVGYGLGASVLYAAFYALGPRLRALLPEGRSLTDFAWNQYGRWTHAFTLIASIFYMFIHLAAELTAIGLLASLIADVSPAVAAGVVAAGTVLYTAYGGLKASLFTDQIQAVLVLVLFLLLTGVVLVTLGGLSGVGAILAGAPEVTMVHWPGAEYGLALFLAILSANLFHHGYWQRVYAGRDERALRVGFGITALVGLPIIFLAGSAGLIAGALGLVEVPSTALFALTFSLLPQGMTLAIFMLAVVLVMSTTDTLLNGMASLFAIDSSRFHPIASERQLLTLSRILTVLLVIPAVYVASRGYSVLVLFLIADLICAAGVVPLFYGFYRRRHTGPAAIGSWLAGLAVGVPLFLHQGPFTYLFASFAAGLLVSTLSCVVLDFLRSKEEARASGS